MKSTIDLWEVLGPSGMSLLIGMAVGFVIGVIFGVMLASSEKQSRRRR